MVKDIACLLYSPFLDLTLLPMLLRFSSLVVLFGALLPGASQAFQLAKNTIRLPSLMKLHDAGNSPRHLPDDNAVVEPTSDRRGFFKESGSSLALLLLMGGR